MSKCPWNIWDVCFCSYIYCETISVNTETAAALMYAASKCLLPMLVKACGKCLSNGLNINNFIHALDQSLLYNDTELRSKCLTFIGLNAKTIFAGKEILSVSQQAIKAILRLDQLLLNEIIIYETCLAWAKHQLQIKRSTENPTDQQIR